MDENMERQNGYTGEYGNPVEHNEAPGNHTEETAGKQQTDNQSDSTYSYSYQNGQDNQATRSGDYYAASNENAANTSEGQAQNQSQNSQGAFGAGGYGPQGQGPQNGPVNGAFYQAPNGPHKAGKPKKPAQDKPMGAGKKVLFSILCAVIFGVVAGACFQGVRYVTDRFMPSTTTTTTKLKTTTEGSSNTASTGTDSKNSTTTATTTTDVSGIVEQTMPSIVAITSTTQGANYYDLFGQQYAGQDTTSAGSGFIVAQNDKELLIATNNHVIDGAKTISVQFIDDQVYEATVKGTDSTNDLAVIAVKVSDVKQDTMDKIRIADLGSSDDLKVGEMAIAIGNALGYGQSVTVGYISAKDREISESESNSSSSNTIKAIQTDAAINPGNSGGALLNMQGQVIGINSAKIASSEVEGVGYAIPISVATPIIEQLMNRETLKDSDKGYLGISGKTVSDEAVNYNVPNGVYVAEVSKDGAADKAGIKKGDIITAINKMEVRSIESLQEKANSYKKGTEVEITFQRSSDGAYKEQTVKVTLQGSDSLNGLSSGSTDNSGSSNNDNSGNSGSQGNNGNNGNYGSDGSNGSNGSNGSQGNDGSDNSQGGQWFNFGDLFN